MIEANHYREARAALLYDPVILAMAKGLDGVPLAELQHNDGTPRHGFMLPALHEYTRRGGEVETHIGGPAEVLLLILRAERQAS